MQIIFTARDLTHVRLLTGWDPLAETVRSARMLRRRELPWLNPWRTGTRSGLDRRMRPLLELVPATGWFPDFLISADHPRELTPALEELRSTPGEAIDADLAQIAAERPLPPVARALADSPCQTLGQVTNALAAYHHLAVAPHREKIRASIDAERAQRARALADGGLDLLLATLHPRLRWTAPCLEIINSKPDTVVRLAGRGLLIAPQVFASVPVLGPPSAGHAPTLFYPVPDDLRTLALGSGPRRYGGDLAGLLGRTRARALAATANSCTTTELARRLGITPATASEHCAILRNAGLVVTRRHRNSVLHTLTPLGRALLQANRIKRPPEHAKVENAAQPVRQA